MYCGYHHFVIINQKSNDNTYAFYRMAFRLIKPHLYKYKLKTKNSYHSKNNHHYNILNGFVIIRYISRIQTVVKKLQTFYLYLHVVEFALPNFESSKMIIQLL